MHSFDDDKELDLLSKAAAEAIDAPSAANWEKMQRALDRELPLEKKRRGGLVWWLIPTLLVAGLGIYFLNLSPKTNSESNLAQPNNTLPPTTKANQSVSETVKTEQVEQQIQTQQNTTKVTSTKNNTITRNSVATASKKTPESLTTINNSPVQKTVPITNNTVSSDLTNNKQSNTIPSASNQQNVTTAVANQPVETKAIEQKTEYQINKTVNKAATIKVQNAYKGFFVGITGGFDASTVKFHYASPVGYNMGAVLGYRFNQNWSVQTGAIYTQKNYKLNGKDFHAPKGSWASYYEIETVDGFCKMWDVPIIATYHFPGNNNGNTFVSIGTSSYFMKHENYNYVYDVNNQYYTRPSSINSSDKHLFALLHLSAGIEKPISKSITSIIEPYAKIPLAGVGFGSIQLSSFGLNFSVQYRQPKK